MAGPVAFRRPLKTLLVGVCAAAVLLSGASHTAGRATAAVAGLPSCGAATVETPGGGPVLLQKPAVATAVKNIVSSLQTLREQNGIASISVAAVYDQSMVFSAGIGCADIDQQTPATPKTVYMIGSITKTFTATMLLQLRDAGWLNLDDALSSYLPDATFLAPAGGSVSPTFRQLASHASGLPRSLLPEPATVDALFKRLQTVKASSDPGTAYAYSNVGYAVLGNALARMTGIPYEQYISSYVLQPLGMNDSTFQPDATLSPRVATGYTQLNASSAGVVDTPVAAAQRGVFDPGGGLLSTADDMARYISLQFNDSSTVLSAASRTEMYQPVIAADQTDSGAAAPGLYATVGWFNLTSNPVPAISKDGAWTGFNAFLLIFPRAKLGVIVLENVDASLALGPASPPAIATLVANRLDAALNAAGAAR